MSFLEARNVCKIYRSGSRAEVAALQDVSLQVGRGSFTILTGPSGSGKSTLLALLGALDRPTRGQALFEGQDLARYSDVGLARVRRRWGFIFQDLALIPGLPAWENITYPLIPRGFSRSQRHTRARELLEQFSLADRSTALPEELSGGEQQRVAGARALAGEPEVLFADEPTSSLDLATGQQLLTVFKNIHAQGTTILMATHDPALIALATCTVELRGGRRVPSAS